MTVVVKNDAYKPEEDDQPVLLAQEELNNLTRNLDLSKESTQQRDLRIKEKNLFAPVFTFQDKSL